LGAYLTLIRQLSRGPEASWFRGHIDASWPLRPSIQREFSEFLQAPEDFYEHERYYASDFQHAASVILAQKPALDDFSGWLTLMQHYGLPTRLLDWSRSALFALYFTIVDGAYIDNRAGETVPVDGAVWLLDPFALNKMAALEEKTYLYHMQHWTAKGVVQTAFRRNSKSEWERHRDSVVACYATEHDPRVANQQSVFTVHSSLRSLEDIAGEWREAHPERPLLQKIIIPGECKEEIIRDLYTCGITHRTVFPDLEHVALDIRRYYGKKR
jgi:hypothetical protein